MNRIRRFLHVPVFVVTIAALPFLLQNCIPPTVEDPETSYKPILMSRPDLESNVKFLPPQNEVTPGRIYLKDGFLYINEVGKGFHVYDNMNPANPVNIGFIQVFGAYDISIRNNTCYIDNACDLIAVQFNPVTKSFAIKKRIRDIIEEPAPPDNRSIPSRYKDKTLRGDSVIIGWQKK